NSKDLAYRFFKEHGIGIIPDYYSVTTADDFMHAYDLLKEKYSSVCFKFVNDEGGNSFRRIVDYENAFSELRWRQGSRVTIRKAYAALSEVERFDPMIVMPYLPGEEISVDCLKTQDGIIAVPRYKGLTRAERIKYDPEILRYCSDFYSKVNLEMPCNIQFKYSGEVPYILEVNTRMSGGVQMSYAGSGVNIPNIAINKLLGRPKKWHLEHRECTVSYVETPIRLSD
ncbi:MAG: ATP-grasp domain-containing protein, partial [Lachnospiraceae bacterium]|nr:ATP-grasp domain-containing protein [Lachnospiraceae bacterium]